MVFFAVLITETVLDILDEDREDVGMDILVGSYYLFLPLVFGLTGIGITLRLKKYFHHLSVKQQSRAFCDTGIIHAANAEGSY